MPLDPGRHWLAAGITGLARQREWDAVATAELPGTDGEEARFVVLPGGGVVVESAEPELDPGPLAAALEGELEPPYRAFAVRRPELWAIGVVAIEVARLEPDPRGDDLELTWSGSSRALSADGMPADPSRGAALERIASEREDGPYAAHAHRLAGDLWEIQVLPL